MNFSLCIDALFGEGAPPAESLAALAKAGFSRYEFWGWWQKDIGALARLQQELGLALVCLCTRFIPLTDAARHAEYLEGLEETIAVAKRLGCDKIITQTGNELPGVPRATQHANLVQGLKLAAPALEQAGITLLVEPLNLLVDHPGYYLSTTPEACAVVDEVGSGSVKLLFDIYHQQITEGNLIRNITNNIDKIAHFHAAGNPGRGTIAAGEIDYHAVFKAIEDAGYTGSVGLEFFPPEGGAIAALEEIRRDFSQT